MTSAPTWIRELGGKPHSDAEPASNERNKPYDFICCPTQHQMPLMIQASPMLDKIPEQNRVYRLTGKEARGKEVISENENSDPLASKVHRWLSAVEETAKKADIMAQESAELKSELERLMKEIVKTRHQLMERRPPLHPAHISYQPQTAYSLVNITNGIQDSCCTSKLSDVSRTSVERYDSPCSLRCEADEAVACSPLGDPVDLFDLDPLFEVDVDLVLKNLGTMDLWVTRMPHNKQCSGDSDHMPVAMQSAYDIAHGHRSKIGNHALDNGIHTQNIDRHSQTPTSSSDNHDKSESRTNKHPSDDRSIGVQDRDYLKVAPSAPMPCCPEQHPTHRTASHATQSMKPTASCLSGAPKIYQEERGMTDDALWDECERLLMGIPATGFRLPTLWPKTPTTHPQKLDGIPFDDRFSFLESNREVPVNTEGIL